MEAKRDIELNVKFLFFLRDNQYKMYFVLGTRLMDTGCPQKHED